MKLPTSRFSLIRLPLRVVLLIAVLGLSGCGREDVKTGMEPALTEVILQTDWFSQPEHGGFYQALANLVGALFCFWLGGKPFATN